MTYRNDKGRFEVTLAVWNAKLKTSETKFNKTKGHLIALTDKNEYKSELGKARGMENSLG